MQDFEKIRIESCIKFALEDFKEGINNQLTTENKLLILFEEQVKEEKKYTKNKWLFIGVVLGMIIVRVLQFIIPYG